MVELRPRDPPPPSLSLAAGIALIEAVDVAVPGLPLILKWPNDLLLGSGKVAGVLLERSGDRIVGGFGVNLAVAPNVVGRTPASLDGLITPQAFAPLLAGSFARLLALWRSSEPGVLAQMWLERAHPPGTALTVHLGPDETIAGYFEGIEADGALRLRRENGSVEIVRAGDVEL